MLLAEKTFRLSNVLSRFPVINVAKVLCHSDFKPPNFKSAINLGNVYPESKLDIAAPQPIPSSEERFSGFIPMNKISKSYARSSGPGGQNVNKRNTKVTVSFHLASADWIPAATRRKLAQIHKNSISKEGWWSVRSEKTRDQHLNLADCIDKIRCYVTEADIPVTEPAPEALEEKRLQLEKAAQRRLQVKRHQSMIKAAKQVFL